MLHFLLRLVIRLRLRLGMGLFNYLLLWLRVFGVELSEPVDNLCVFLSLFLEFPGDVYQVVWVHSLASVHITVAIKISTL